MSILDTFILVTTMLLVGALGIGQLRIWRRIERQAGLIGLGIDRQRDSANLQTNLAASFGERLSGLEYYRKHHTERLNSLEDMVDLLNTVPDSGEQLVANTPRARGYTPPKMEIADYRPNFDGNNDVTHTDVEQPCDAVRDDQQLYREHVDMLAASMPRDTGNTKMFVETDVAPRTGRSVTFIGEPTVPEVVDGIENPVDFYLCSGAECEDATFTGEREQPIVTARATTRKHKAKKTISKRRASVRSWLT